MSLTEEGYLQRKWGPYPSLGKSLWDKRVPDHHFGLTTAHDNKFEAVGRLMEIAVLVDEYESEIKKVPKSVSREEMRDDLLRLENELDRASYFFTRSICRLREVSASLELTEKDAAIAYAKAWNRLNCYAFLELLDEGVHYASQWVFDELENKDAIADYLIGKMKTIKNTGSKVCAELGNTRSGFEGRDCVFMVQGEKEEIQAVVIFELANNKIQRYDLCIPQAFDVERTGVYPT